MEVLLRLRETLRVDPAQSFAGLALFPLLGPPEPAEREYRTLDEALEAGDARVTEVSRAGSVPLLRFVNDGDRPVLLLDGEELVGAKQNRVLNLTILAPSHASIDIPVSCVESGRWSPLSEQLDAACHVMHSVGRHGKLMQVTASLERYGNRHSDQAAVWSDIARLAERFEVRSETLRMEDVFRARRAQLDEYVAAFPAVDGQVGAVFALGRRLCGIELFDHPATLAALLPKLVRSWALEADGARDAKPEAPPASVAESWLEAISRSAPTRHPAVGLGVDLRFDTERLSGAALAHDDRAVHLCAFAHESDGSPPTRRCSGRIDAASRRARYRAGGNGS